MWPMAGRKIQEPWYQKLADEYGAELAVEAGYFDEEKPWGLSYQEVWGEDFLKKTKSSQALIQFSGAFWPFHQGHLEILQRSIDFLSRDLLIFIHVDHRDYRLSKGSFDLERAHQAFNMIRLLQSKNSIETRFLFEDQMPNGCSRNFTRLYEELLTVNPNTEVWFLAGGDRAAFSLSFKQQGHCLIVGRDQAPAFERYRSQASSQIVFLEGHNSHSSSLIRKAYGK